MVAESMSLHAELSSNSRPWKTMITPSPITTATLQATGLSLVSNILAQLIDAHQSRHPASVDLHQLLRFVAFAFVTTPPYYLWQEYLERKFPAQYPSCSTSDPKSAGGCGEGVGVGVELMAKFRPASVPAPAPPPAPASAPADEEDGGIQWRLPSPVAMMRRRQLVHVRNTLAKWFIDCLTVGTALHTVAFLVFMSVMKGEPSFQIRRNVRKETLPIIINDYKVWPLASIISFTCLPVERRVVFLSFVEMLWDIYVSLVAAKI